MATEPEKVRTGFYIEKEVLERCDALLTAANVKYRNEFVTEALRFYCGYLTSQQSENYLLQSLSSVLISTIRDTENRLARMDCKIATELSKRKENMEDSEQQLYSEVKLLSAQARDIVKTLPEDQQRILEDYFVKTNLIVDHDCQHLYVQGAKDCVELLQKLGVL